MGRPLPPKNLGAKFISPPLEFRVWFRLFLAIGPEKEYPKLVLKFWGLTLQKEICRGQS